MASIQQSIEVNVPADIAYVQLMKFSEYPRFMLGVDEIRQTDERHLHWRVTREGKSLEWDSEIIEQVPDRSVAWQNSGDVTESGKIMLSPQDGDKTKITLVMEFDTARLSGMNQGKPADCEAAMAEYAGQDLARFKKFVESVAAGGDGRSQTISQGTMPAMPGTGAAHAAQARSAGYPQTGAGQAPQDMSELHTHSGYSGPEGSQAQPVSGYAAGSEGWDGNEDPGTPVISSSRRAGDGAPDRAIGMPEVGISRSRPAAGTAGAQVNLKDAAPESGPAPGAQHRDARPSRPEGHGWTAGIDAASDSNGEAEKERSQSWMPNLLRAWEEPFVVMRKMTDEMDQLFEKFVGRPMAAVKARAGMASQGDWSPPIEVSQRANEFLISVDIPGVRREDVQIEIQGDRLVIEGDRHEEIQGISASATEEDAFRHTERSYGHFYRVISLPSGADGDAASASIQDGILRVVVPIQPVARQGRKVDIRP